jgi:hypothetical protein
MLVLLRLWALYVENDPNLPYIHFPFMASFLLSHGLCAYVSLAMAGKLTERTRANVGGWVGPRVSQPSLSGRSKNARPLFFIPHS